MKIIGWLVAAVPFAFAGLRLAATGNDTRYLWMAVAASACAVAILVRDRAKRIGVAAIGATACTAAVGLLLGARAAAGIALVALGFGVCSAVGIGLLIRARPRAGQ